MKRCHLKINLKTKTFASDSTIYNTGSNFKSVTATAIMQLHERGLIDINRPINDYLKTPINYFDDSTPITAKHLMSHQSGIPASVGINKVWQRKTAKTLKEDVLQGFKIGADDYITKPFNSEELLYRIQAILKRSRPKPDPREEIREFNIGKYHFNYPLRILTFNAGQKDENKVKLSPKEAQLLRMFAMYINDVLPRSEALTKIWGEDNYFTARSMDVFVTKLRKYLAQDKELEIVNIHGNGFQLLVKGQGESV